MTDDIAVSVKDLSKNFLLPHERKNSLKETLLHFRKPSYEIMHALQDINFDVKRGEFFGIVGRNGSGKSTLLKLLGGIYQPTKGSVRINGTLTPFIELGIGFNPELTGRENVYLNGAILGLSRKEITTKYDEVVAFAEMERFMDQKLKNYSSGMQVRLAFSIAIQAHNDILLIDEVLAVGDAAFQRKCYNTFKQIKKAGKTIIFVTHDMGAVQEFCDRAMMIEDSKMLTIGSPREVALRYEVANSSGGREALGNSARPHDPDIRLDSLIARSAKGHASHFSQDDPIYVDVNFTVRQPLAVQFNVFLAHPDGRFLAGINTTTDLKDYKPTPGTHTITCTIASNQLTKGEYRINVAVYTFCSWPSNETPRLIDVLDTAYGVDVPKITITTISPNQNGEFNMHGSWVESTSSAEAV